MFVILIIAFFMFVILIITFFYEKCLNSVIKLFTKIISSDKMILKFLVNALFKSEGSGNLG